jgi:hypothetical protein
MSSAVGLKRAALGLAVRGVLAAGCVGSGVGSGSGVGFGPVAGAGPHGGTGCCGWGCAAAGGVDGHGRIRKPSRSWHMPSVAHGSSAPPGAGGKGGSKSCSLVLVKGFLLGGAFAPGVG